MDELLSPPDEIERSDAAFTPDLLQSTIDSDSWLSLEPNLPSPEQDLLPQELNVEQITTIIEALMADASLANYQTSTKDIESIAADAFKGPLDLGEAGVLTFVGNGEAKICYCLSRGDKKMAILLQSYGEGLGVQVPQDPHLTQITRGPTRRQWEYSGLRTYAMLPLTGSRAVKLQEFGEPATRSHLSPINAMANTIVRHSATNYIRNKLPNSNTGPESKTVQELKQTRHFLSKTGHRRSIAIDIPVEERIA